MSQVVGPVQSQIESKLQSQLSPSFLSVENESHMHSVPPNSETHFKLVLVSEMFSGKRSVQRHQMVYRGLADEVAGPVHALAMHTYTRDEWQDAQGEAPASPQCLGGSKSA